MRFFLLWLIVFNIVFADTIEDLLKVIEVKSDLSEKTKLQNGGVSFIYTRSDLERMQINKLKDILQTLPSIEYKESSYGFPDLFTLGDNKAFISNNVRVFIDNQEIATGMYGSGFMLLGDMDLDFVDHIEVYLNNPSYEYTTEPTLVLIKLYTKTAKKDNGGKVKVGYNNYHSKSASIYYANQFVNGWNYFSYLSYNQNNRKKYTIKDTTISRDYPTLNALASIYDENNRFLLQVISQKKDSFGDTSIDFTPTEAKVDSDFIHFGYDGNYNNFYLLVDFDRKITKSYFIDDVEPLEEYNYLYPIASQISTIDANLANVELKYKYKKEKNTLITGIKYRYKWFEYTTLIRNDIELPKTGNDKQIVSSVFLENQYSIKSNSILNIGLMFEKVRNNASEQQDNIFNYRIGHTYTTQDFTFKTIIGQTEFSIDPYLVNSTGFFIKDETVKKTKEKTIMENIVYKKDSNRYEFLVSYNVFENVLVPDMTNQYLLYNLSEKIKNYELYTSWTKDYNEIDKFFMSFEYQKYNLPTMNDFKKEKIVLRNQNTFKKYDLFNELIYIHVNDKAENYYIYNLGLKYHYSKDFIISLKGENLFNDSYKQYYLNADPNTLIPQEPIQIPTIDRTILLSMEYYF